MMKKLSTDCRNWFYFPIDIPYTAEGLGPATVGVDAAQVVYEVWDKFYNTHGEFGNLYDAINKAIELNLKDISDGI